MKRFFFVTLLASLMGLAGIAALAQGSYKFENAKHSCESESFVITDISPISIDGESEAGDDEYTITLSCPNCRQLMSAKFKLGYGSTTKATCPKCHKKYLIEYSWPRDHKEPTIKKIKETN